MAARPPTKLHKTVTGLKNFQVPQLQIASKVITLHGADMKEYRLKENTEGEGEKFVPDIPGFKWKPSLFVDVYSNELGEYELDKAIRFNSDDFALVDLIERTTPYVICNGNVVQGGNASEQGKELKRFFGDADLARRYGWKYRVCRSDGDRAQVVRELGTGTVLETVMNGVYGCTQDLFWKYLSVMCEDLLKNQGWKLVDGYELP